MSFSWKSSAQAFIASFIAASLFLSVPSIAHFSSDYDPYFYTLLHFSPSDPPVAGEASDTYVSVFNATSGDPVTSLDTVHERKLHLFVVSDDFETFSHVHPEDRPDGLSLTGQGQYLIGHTFPEAGLYAVLVDFTSGGVTVLKRFEVFVLSSPADSYAPTREAPEPEFSREKVFGRYTVRLDAPDRILAGSEVEIGYHIEEGGEPVTDLQQYLGSEIHAVFVRSDLSQAAHTHAYVPFHSIHAGRMAQRYYGPDVPVRHAFQEPGDYAVFSQFRHGGEIVTAKFWLKVEADPVRLAYSYLPYAFVAAFAAFVFRRELSRLLSGRKKPRERLNTIPAK